MFLVKTSGKELRPCVDYRKLNSVTKIENYLLPNIEDRIEKMSAVKYTTVLDLKKGYWHRAQKLSAVI